MTSLANVVDLIVFDFDGTICESADVKTDAFYRLYLDERGPEFATAVRDYHLEHVGISRFDKIVHVEETMLGRQCTDERLHLMAERFGSLVTDAVIAAPYCDGVPDFLDTFAGVVPMVIASATPTDELRYIVAARGLGSSFEAVEGSPSSKAEIINEFLVRRGAQASRTVVVGDQLSDLNGARAAGVGFVGFRPQTNDRLFENDVPVVAHFDQLGSAIISAMSRFAEHSLTTDSRDPT